MQYLITRSAQYPVSVIKRSSVRPSAHLSCRSTAASAGSLLRSGAGSRYRSIVTAAVRHAGRVNVGPTVRTSNILLSCVHTGSGAARRRR